MIRYNVSEELKEQFIIKEQEKVHHLKNVLKLEIGEVIYLVNKDQVGEYRIINIDDIIVLELLNSFKEDNELNVKVDLIFSPLKKNNTELVIQKAVELGVNNIYVTNFNRSIAKFLKTDKKINNKREKFDKIIVGAIEQSRRNYKPEIFLAFTLNDINFEQYDEVFLCYENAENNMLINHYKEIKKAKNILIIIGPEGGIDQSEINKLKDKVKIISLGKRILRAETAVFNALSVISSIDEGKL